MSVVGKCFTNILNTLLNVFRKGMSKFEDYLYGLHSLITHCINERKTVCYVYIDFKKSFDFVVRDILWFKLIQIGSEVRFKILSSSCIEILNQVLNLKII